MALVDLDFQFLDEGNLLGIENGFAFDYDNLFEDNPVNGKDINLASTLSKEFDPLACASTDAQECPDKSQKSPWHESDSGMSEVSYAGSPQSNFEDGETENNGSMTILVNVENSDNDSDLLSPSSASGQPKFTSRESRKRRAEEIFQFEEANPQALEFFSSSDTFSAPQKIRVVGSSNDTGCTSNKNAIQAKINREKKKAYINSLEEEVKFLKDENSELKSENTRMQTSMTELEEEVSYLKSVLVNSSALSNLLKNIPQVKEVKLSGTVVGRKRTVGDDHAYNLESTSAKRQRNINENLRKAGVCLHVNDGSACLEFCAHCSKLAQKTSMS